MNKYLGIYRIDSTRLQKWDYSWQGKYFVTMCTQGRAHYFGEISDGVMNLSEIGIETERQWLDTVSLRPDMNLKLHDFQVMPNHFHGIIEIGWNTFNNCRTTRYDESAEKKNKFGPQRKNLASIIRGFKGSVARYARKNNILFDWQPNYHDHLIRNDQEFFKIKRYIQNNVKNWKGDRFKRISK